MNRPIYDADRKLREGGALKKYFSETKKFEPRLTRKKLTAEMGVTPSVYSQWVGGATRIPDRHLVFLAKRLGFNALDLRPELANSYSGFEATELLLRVRKLDSKQRVIVSLFIDWLIDQDL